MSTWDKRYNEKEDEGIRPPSRILKELISRLPLGKALDLACGDGRNAIFLAERGFQVDAVDSSMAAVERGKSFAIEAGLNVNFICADLESFEIQRDSYHVITNFYYLQRSLIPEMKKGLKEGGAILFETYTLEQKELGRPRNLDYLLGDNELLQLFSDMHISYYREGLYTEGEAKKALATVLCGKK